MNLSGQRNQCRGCGHFFNSNSAFDKHRTGEYGIDRRCRTPAEMTALGMAVNASGFWVGSLMDNRFFEDALDE